MENVEFHSIEEVDDISTLDEYKVALEAGLEEKEALQAVAKLSRDNARTPMQWDDSENAGFTTGKPWLRVNPNYKKINVKEQLEDEDSVLGFYKKLIALRKNPEYKDTIVYGTLEPVWEERCGLMAYYRKGEKTLLVIGNYQKEEQELLLPNVYKKVLLNNYPHLSQEKNKLLLRGYQVLILEM